MHSTTKLTETDPHDDFAIAPDIVPAAWADRLLADIKGDANSHPSDQQPPTAFSAAGPAAPTLDTTFRAAADDIKVAGDRPSTGRWTTSAVTVFLIALCSALAVAASQHYGDAAKQMISNWTPPFALASSPPPEQTAPAEQAGAPAVQASAADPAAQQPAAPAQPPEDAAPAAAAPAQDSAQLLQSMARDLAAMGQQIDQLKASIAELKAGQQPASPGIANTSEVRTPATRTSEAKASEKASDRTPVQNLRPKMPAPPQRSPAAQAHKLRPAYPPAQAAAIPPLPQAVPAIASPPPAPPPAAARLEDDEPIVRPPMPLR